jgi:hypothetical protein
MIAQLSIPIWVILLNGARKKSALKAGLHQPESATNNKAWPLPVVLTSNALENQFQFPIVFYVLCLILAQLEAVSVFGLSVAWVYVVSRWGHAIVHVTSNTVAYRFRCFAVSMLALITLFIHLVVVMLLINPS